jgi:hypothetical protein
LNRTFVFCRNNVQDQEERNKPNKQSHQFRHQPTATILIAVQNMPEHTYPRDHQKHHIHKIPKHVSRRTPLRRIENITRNTTPGVFVWDTKTDKQMAKTNKRQSIISKSCSEKCDHLLHKTI